MKFQYRNLCFTYKTKQKITTLSENPKKKLYMEILFWIMIALSVIFAALFFFYLLVEGMKKLPLFRLIVWVAIIGGLFYWIGIKTTIIIAAIVFLLGAIQLLYEKVVD